ncbi:Hypothetical_protein [Hexamita inflata]|uniref:Hypothetical_protein n=1 Tax=Hexamita inflata TaxID=28002 RepID=A0AA86NRD9_9EUKA|nr:Hypothetical protein HINF_LOCUS12717 [Hexamita inflata]
MFTYKYVEDRLLIAQNHFRYDCQNNLSQFYGKSFSQVDIQGVYYSKQLEFVLQSYQMHIQSVIIDKCSIDFSKAKGEFQDITFSDCELINDMTDAFRAKSLTFASSLKLSQLQRGLMKKINVNVSVSYKIDFEGAVEVASLNELIFQTMAIVDLSKLEGIWNSVRILDCTVNKQLGTNFYVKHFYIISKEQNILNNLQNFSFNNLEIIINQGRDLLLDPKLFLSIKWKAIKLTLINMKLDMQQLTGRFNELNLNSCCMINYGTEKLYCHKLSMFNCKKHHFSTNVLHKINCKKLYIQQCPIVDYLPQYLQELSVNNCEINFKSQCQHLQIINLNYIYKIKYVNMNLFPILNQITSDRKLEVVQHIQVMIKTRTKFQKKSLIHDKRKDNVQMQRITISKNLSYLSNELQFCIDNILYSFQNGFE